MTTATTETKGPGGAKGPRVWKDKPTDRERVICGSLAETIKELTGRDVSPETVRAVRWSTSRWYDSVGKDLMQNMDGQLKRAKAQAKFEAAQQALKEAQAELGDYDEDADEAASDETDAFDEVSEADSDDSDDDADDDDDVFDEGKSVSASF